MVDSIYIYGCIRSLLRRFFILLVKAHPYLLLNIPITCFATICKLAFSHRSRSLSSTSYPTSAWSLAEVQPINTYCFHVLSLLQNGCYTLLCALSALSGVTLPRVIVPDHRHTHHYTVRLKHALCSFERANAVLSQALNESEIKQKKSDHSPETDLS